MTSVVSISAHCGDTKEVHVVVTDAGSLVEDFHIANGEKAERYAYDDRVISVKEVVKIDRRAEEIEDAEFSLRQATLRYEDAASRGFPLGNEVLLKADVATKRAGLDALTAPAVPSVADYAASYPIPNGVVNADPLAAVFDPAGHALMTNPVPATETKTYTDGSTATGPGPLPDQSPAQQESDTNRDTMSLSPEAVAFLNSLDPADHALMGSAEPIPATPGDAGYETKTYADGTTAFGLGPLPDQSPAEQGVARKEISDFLAAQSGVLPAESKAFLDSLDPAPAISDGTTDSVEGPTES